jgi:hypothetical protein
MLRASEGQKLVKNGQVVDFGHLWVRAPITWRDTIGLPKGTREV